MASGEKIRGGAATDPIVRAIALAEAGTTGEVRVHLSKRLFEKNAFNQALWLFDRFGMSRTKQRNAVLLYVNLRRHRFAVVADQALHQTLGQNYWQQFSREFAEEMRGTDPERGIAIAVAWLGEKLKLHFPEES
jgi:uncharacterized membrane protein